MSRLPSASLMPSHLLCLHYFEIISLAHLFQKTWRNVSTGAMKPLMSPRISILRGHEIFAAPSGLCETDRATDSLDDVFVTIIS